MSGKRLLNVTVLEARQVLGIESASASDTYAKISFIDIASRDIKNESAKTKVVGATINPKWGVGGAGESFRFGENYDLSNTETLPTMRVALFDKNTFSADIPMGCVEVPLEQVDAAPDGIEQWFPLQRDTRAKMKGASRGEVLLRVNFVASGETGHHSAADLSPFAAAAADDETQQPNRLLIRVIDAKELPVMDARTLLGTGTNSSDPFVTITVEAPLEASLKVRTRARARAFARRGVCERRWISCTSSHLTLSLTRAAPTARQSQDGREEENAHAHLQRGVRHRLGRR